MRSKLVEARINAGLTQEEMANLIGVTRSCYSNYELGTRRPPIQKIILMKKILKIKQDEFFLTDDDTKGIENNVSD